MWQYGAFFLSPQSCCQLLTVVKKKSSFKTAKIGENAGTTIRKISKLTDINSMCYYKMTK